MLIDKKKLNDAFKRMRRAGLLAKQRFACCKNCATKALGELADEIAAGGDPCLGFAYYHAQDNDARLQGQDFYIGFGVAFDQNDNPVRPFREVAQITCECLKMAGVPFSWNGRTDTRIMVEQQAATPARKEVGPRRKVA